LAIDIIDPQTKKLIWRGSSTDTFSKLKEGRKVIEHGIKDIMKRFPPR
jgi:hypothetical protein